MSEAGGPSRKVLDASRTRSEAEVVFELTVDGELGPVLRRALGARAVEHQPCTVFRATAVAGSGMAELVRVLDAAGLIVESIRAAGPDAGQWVARPGPDLDKGPGALTPAGDA